MKAIVLYDENRAIARKGEQIAKIPADLSWFRKVTMGNTVVMGTKTAEAIGHPLEGRRNVVLTHNPGVWWNKHRDLGNGKDTGWEVAQPSVFREILLAGPRLEFQKTFIIGGESIYEYFFPIIEWIYATEVHANLKGDKHFPEFLDENQFRIFRSEPEEIWNGVVYQHRIYVRSDVWVPQSQKGQ